MLTRFRIFEVITVDIVFLPVRGRSFPEKGERGRVLVVKQIYLDCMVTWIEHN